MKKLNVYIIHASFLIERRRVIDELKKNLGKYSFSKLKVNDIVTLENNDPSSLSTEKIQQSINYQPLQTEDETLKIYNSLTRVLHVNNVSNALNHFEAIKKISECPDEDTLHLVLEDDVIFEPRMCMLLDKSIEKVASEDIVFLGMPNNEPAPANNNIILKETKAIFKILPYNDSYFISHSCAKKLAESFMPIKYYTNIHLSYLFDKHGIVPKQTIPNIFVDGSKYGMYTSTLMSNNDLVFNREFMFIKNILQKPKDTITREEKDTVYKLIKESQIAAHPDFLSLTAKFYKEVEADYKKARDTYQLAHESYLKNNAIVNNESAFLRDYINVHSFLQEDA
jgi:GR25 family glycosyltransferase involved in LPS biosynthesis